MQPDIWSCDTDSLTAANALMCTQFMKDEDFMRHHLYQMEHLIDKYVAGVQRCSGTVLTV